MDSKLDVQAVPGLEATHSWNAGVVVLGDNQGAFPRFYLDEIQGIHGLPEFDDPRVAATGLGREIVYPGLPRGKAISYLGRTQADTMEACRWRSGQLRAAMLADPEALAEQVMKIIPKVAYGGHTYRFKARVQRFEQDDKIAFSAFDMPQYQRNFLITVRMSDGRFIVDDSPQSYQTPAAGGANDPFIDVLNMGTAPADPVIRIQGPTVGPKIARPNYYLTLVGANIAAGHYADVDFANRTILTDAGVDLIPTLDPASNWWDRGIRGIPESPADGSGTTTRVTLSQPGGHPGAGAYARVQFDPAVW